jgi:4-amino-4-deoxy-L-arabinose transferase-like glycosyltransferase
MTARRVLQLVLIAAAVSFPVGAPRKLWVLDEVRYAAVVADMHQTGRWFAPHLNGEFFEHKPPLYFWLVGGITELAGGQSEFVLYAIAWLLSLACIIAAYFFIRALLPERVAWLAAIVMATSFLYTITTGIARMDLMMLALMVAGLLAFVRGYMTGRRCLYAWFFVCCALAVMTKGPYGILLPLVGVLVFLAWERRLDEALTPWFLGGFLIGLGILAAWLAALCLVEGARVLRLYVVHQTLGRAAQSWAHAEPFWYYAAWLPVEFLPWVAFVPRGFVLMRRRHPTAFRFLVATAATSSLVLSAVSCKLFVYILAIWPPLAAAAAFALCEREGKGRALQIETTVTGVLLLAAGAAAYMLGTRHVPDKMASVAPLSVVLVGIGAVLAAASWLPQPPMRRRIALVTAVLVATGLVFWRLCALVATPAFNDTMSPQAAGERMRAYAEEGYAVASCGVPFGTYNYYARVCEIRELDGPSVIAFLDQHTRAVVAIRGTSLDAIRDSLPPGVEITAEHILELKPHFLFVKEE